MGVEHVPKYEFSNSQIQDPSTSTIWLPHQLFAAPFVSCGLAGGVWDCRGSQVRHGEVTFGGMG